MITSVPSGISLSIVITLNAHGKLLLLRQCVGNTEQKMVGEPVCINSPWYSCSISKRRGKNSSIRWVGWLDDCCELLLVDFGDSGCCCVVCGCCGGDCRRRVGLWLCGRCIFVSLIGIFWFHTRNIFVFNFFSFFSLFSHFALRQIMSFASQNEIQLFSEKLFWFSLHFAKMICFRVFRKIIYIFYSISSMMQHFRFRTDVLCREKFSISEKRVSKVCGKFGTSRCKRETANVCVSHKISNRTGL